MLSVSRGHQVSFNTTIGVCGGVLLKDNTKLAAVLRLATISFCFDMANLYFKKLPPSVSNHLKRGKEPLC